MSLLSARDEVAGESGNINTKTTDASWGHFKRPRWDSANGRSDPARRCP
jgi:hypothetical protein